MMFKNKVRRILIVLIVLGAVSGMSNFSTAQSISITKTFDSSMHYQGGSGTVTIRITNTWDQQEKITWAGIHFDWEESNVYFYDDTDYGYIGSGSSVTYNIGFNIPVDAFIGSHSYYIKIYYKATHWYGDSSETWQSQTKYDFYVEDADKPVANQKKTEASNAIVELHAMTLRSPEAQGLASDADSAYSTANSYYIAKNYDQAITYYNNAISYANQAKAVEISYTQEQTGNIIDIIWWIVIAVILIIILIVVIIGFKKKHQPSERQPPSFPEDKNE